MHSELSVTLGQCSSAGRKPVNQDFHGAVLPAGPARASKGLAFAIADGISSSAVSHVASEAAVTGFLADYYCTADAWSVKTAANRVLQSVNSWLHAQSRRSPHRGDRDRGYVCTFSGLVLKSTTAHLFHVGDARIYRLRDATLEQLTQDHRVTVADGESYLARALGIEHRLDLDYLAQPLETGDVFVLATDGVHEHVPPASIVAAIAAADGDLDRAAAVLVDAAHAAGSADNLTVQLVRVDQLPQAGAHEVVRHAAGLQFPPTIEARSRIDGFEILRQIHGNSRSRIFLARDEASGALVALKTLAPEMHDDPAALERFLIEEWVARRIDNAHVLRPHARTRRQHYLYVAMEFVEGETLTQWMRDHPTPDLATVRGIVAQIARGLQAFHRQEMLHQDLRPDNVMIDRSGTVKIIDFGAVQVAGLAEAARRQPGELLGTLQYAAPEYFLGEPGSPQSDLFSLAVIAYQLLTGQLPYGTAVSRATTVAAQRKLVYRTALSDERHLPAWVDAALRKALHPDPRRRQPALSEFVADLHRPGTDAAFRTRRPLIERNPTRFWKATTWLLLVVVLILLGRLHAQGG